MNIAIPASGSCQCGAITYRVTDAPLFIYACHCHSCQKRTGSAFSMGVIVPEAALQVSGELTAWSRQSAAGTTNTRHSCAACGNIIYGTDDTGLNMAKVQAGTLDDTAGVAPDVHMWTTSKQPWLSLSAAVPQFETQPDSPMELLQAALDYRAARGD